MEEIYGEKRPVAKETNYYETQRNKREEQFAPSYSADYPKQNYQRQTQRDNTFQGLLERIFIPGFMVKTLILTDRFLSVATLKARS